MDIYDYLKMDHKKVDKLFKLYETALTEINKLEIFAMIDKELSVHADSEAATFYKALEKYRKSEDEALHGEKEHNDIKEKLNEIGMLKTPGKRMDEKIKELKQIVKHHVAEEEGKVFRAAKKVLSKEEAWLLKEQMHDYKEKMLNKVALKETETVE